MQKVLGIELGSTRVKAVLIDSEANLLAEGSCAWENRFSGGFWTYSEKEIWRTLQACFANLSKNYAEKFSAQLDRVDAIGVSAMMHGYLALGKDGELLVPFRTWRNTNTGEAAEQLSHLFDFNIPMRWSVAHFYTAVLNKEPHVKEVAHLTTLAGYVHYMLTGEKALGIGDASGMFPCDGKGYRKDLLAAFDELLKSKGLPLHFEDLLPKVLLAGEDAGTLSRAGARLLDPTGTLQAGAAFCPPEGDAITGMVATDCVKPSKANVSAGTSAFLTAVLDRPLKTARKEIDIVATPTGYQAAMIHVNNFTNELNAWRGIFAEVAHLTGGNAENLMDKLFEKSAEADADVGGLMGYNFLSGEPIVGVSAGRPSILRSAEGNFTLANFMRMQICSALAPLAMGAEILYAEGATIGEVCGHGGFFKAGAVAQTAMSAALKVPVTVMKNAGEGGAWGMAILALYRGKTMSLDAFLAKIFAKAEKRTILASKEERERFELFLQRYKGMLAHLRAGDEGCLKS